MVVIVCKMVNSTVATGRRCTRYQLIRTVGRILVINESEGRIKYMGLPASSKSSGEPGLVNYDEEQTYRQSYRIKLKP